jgi:hypothetical protein
MTLIWPICADERRRTSQIRADPFDQRHPRSIWDAPAKRVQTAENTEIAQRFRELLLGELRASSAFSAVKEVFAVESFRSRVIV